MTQTVIWPSIARLIATGTIFIFHYLGLLQYDNGSLDFYSILTFCFLSGYLARIRAGSRIEWGVKRFFGIMIPYWLVIVPVLILNEIEHYKVVSWIDATVTLFGGNLFITNPVYVIGWYITFVLFLYAYAFIESYFKSYSLILCMAVGFLVFSRGLDKGYYFMAFLAGIRLSNWTGSDFFTKPICLNQSLSRFIFALQQYCYPFFLVHGAVLLFFVKKTGYSEISIFIASLFLSIALSILINKIGTPLKMVAVSAVLRRTSRTGERLRHDF